MSVGLDRQLREYCRLMDEAQGSLSFDDILERSGELPVIPGRTILRASPKRKWIAPAIAALAILIVVIGMRVLLTDDPGPADQLPTTTPLPATALGNGWIAFSTQPGGAQNLGTDWDRGGDIYLVRAGDLPRLIVGRGEAKITNVCPTFSPNGSKLAYGERAGSDSALVVLSVDLNGSVEELTRIDAGAGETAPCPRWSQDGERLAYLAGQVRGVVRGLDGSTLEPRDEDPTDAELRATIPASNPLDGVMALRSPDGALVARLERCLITVANTDGSERREISRSSCDYAVAGWSPDGRYILVMTDGGMDAQMTAIAVEEPFESIVLVASIPVNGARSWPGFGDVSWQPVTSGS